MRGSIKWQVNEIYHKSGIKQIGHSKHAAKEKARSESTKEKGLTWHEIGKKIGIFSYSTADKYRAVWKNLGEHAKKTFKIKDLEKINGEHVKSFLESKIATGVAFKTFSQYASAIEKLESALKGYSENNGKNNTYDFKNEINESRAMAKDILERFEGTRAYDSPDSLIQLITNSQFKIIAQIQLESGARISECNYLTEKNMLGIEKDPYSGQEKGKILIEQAKGGITGIKYVSKETYQELTKNIDSSPEGRFVFNMWSYRESLRDASQNSGQPYTGSHGLRWNFARNRFSEVQEKGNVTYEKALSIVSHEMFHQRPDITEHYLK